MHCVFGDCDALCLEVAIFGAATWRKQWQCTVAAGDSFLGRSELTHCDRDKIDGGNCCHAWRMLTGCQDQYTFQNIECVQLASASIGCLCIHCIDVCRGKFRALGPVNPQTKQLEQLANSPHDSSQILWPMEWPEVHTLDIGSSVCVWIVVCSCMIVCRWQVGGGGPADLGLSANELFERMV